MTTVLDESAPMTAFRRWLSIVLLSAVVVGIILCIPLLQSTSWVGTKALPVEVLVVDTQQLRPVEGAKVTIFAGPPSLLEGGISQRSHADFEPDEQSPETKSAVTNASGRCRLSYSFSAAGSSGAFGRSGYVDTAGIWLRVTRADRPEVLVPLDRQSVRPRDLADETPLVVTVVLNGLRPTP